MSYTEKEVIVLLEKRHAGDEWAFFDHVPDSTGGSSRIADGIAFNLWNSRGLEIHGFEVKCRRQDWINELKNPAKADLIAQYCDRWFIVAPADVVQVEELPPTWGLLEVQKGRLVQRKQAPKLKAKPIPRDFMAAIMRKVSKKDIMPEETSARVKIAYEEGQADQRFRNKLTIERLEEDNARHKEAQETFERITGIRVTGYNAETVAQQFKLFQSIKNSVIPAATRLLSLHEKTTNDLKVLIDAVADETKVISPKTLYEAMEAEACGST